MIEVFRTITQLVVSLHAPQQVTKVEGEWRLYELSFFNPSVRKNCISLHTNQLLHKDLNIKDSTLGKTEQVGSVTQVNHRRYNPYDADTFLLV